MGLLDMFKEEASRAYNDLQREKNDTRSWNEKASDDELRDTLRSSGESISKRAKAAEELQRRGRG